MFKIFHDHLGSISYMYSQMQNLGICTGKNAIDLVLRGGHLALPLKLLKK